MSEIEIALVIVGAAATTFLPWVIPVMYAVLIGLVTRGVDPLWLSIYAEIGAVSGAVILWGLDTYLRDRLSTKIKAQYHNKSRLGRLHMRRHSKLQESVHPWMMFLLVVGTTWSAIPDIVIIRCVRWKLPFFWFVIAAIIGKLFVYTPVIYGVEGVTWLTELLGWTGLPWI